LNDTPENHTPDSPSRGSPRVAGAALAVALTTAAVFAVCLANGYIYPFDDDLLLRNPAVRGFGLEQFAMILESAPRVGWYAPLLMATYQIDQAVANLSPVWVHLVGVVLHALNAALLVIVGRRLLAPAARRETACDRSTLLAGAAGALFFSLHPLRVEAVARASSRGYLLAGTFFLLMLQSHLAARAPGGTTADGPSKVRLHRMLVWLWLGCGLLCGPAMVTAPLVLLILDVWPLGRLGPVAGGWLNRRTAGLWVERLLMLVMVAGVANAAGWREDLRAAFGIGYPAAQALDVAVQRIVFGLQATLVPAGLSAFHDFPHDYAPVSIDGWINLAAVAVITVATIMLRRRLPALTAGWLAYLALCSARLGLLCQEPQVVSDRHTYLPGMVTALLAAGGLLTWLRRPAAEGRRSARLPAVAVGLVLALAATGTVRLAMLWRDTESVWRRVLAVDPNCDDAWFHLGGYHVQAGRRPEAIAAFEQVLALRPDNPWAFLRLGILLAAEDRHEEALARFEKAVELAPDSEECRLELGLALFRANQPARALEQLEPCMRGEPPAGWLARLANHYMAGGEDLMAVRVLHEAVRLMPDDAGLLNNLVWKLATSPEPAARDEPRAAELAERLAGMEETAHQAHMLDTVATAHANVGRFDQAVAFQLKAIEVMEQYGAAGDPEEYRRRLEIFRNRGSYHEPSPGEPTASAAAPAAGPASSSRPAP